MVYVDPDNMENCSEHKAHYPHRTLYLDPSKSPRQIDLTYLDGPFKDVTCQGVYQWGGVNKDMLMLSLQDPGAEVERPKTITMTSGEQTSLIFLNPRKPASPQEAQPGQPTELDSLQGTWSLEIIQTMSWPKPVGKGPDESGQGSEQQQPRTNGSRPSPSD